MNPRTLHPLDEGGATESPPPGNKASELRNVMERFRNRRQLIVLRGYPDPDSIASAMAHAAIAKEFEIEATILVAQEISHEENRALVKRLEVPLVRHSPDLDYGQFDCYAVVDAQTAELPGDPAVRPPVVSLVDHHKDLGTAEAEFVDIREDAGATSSIYAEYLMAGLAPLHLRDPDTERLATALLHGIRTDTDAFFTAREIDYRAASFLSQFADLDLLRVISRQSISPRTMDITQRALEGKIIQDTFLLAGVGFVREEDRDAIGQAADYLVRREGIDTAIVYGVVNDRFIDGSLRTLSDKVDPDRFLKELLGVDERGNAYGGGRKEKGGFRIPIGAFSRCTDRELLWRITQRTMQDLFFAKLGVSPEQPAAA